MLPLDKIRADLKEIRYYYERKEVFDSAIGTIFTERTDVRVHREHIHIIVVRKRSFLFYAVTDRAIVYNVIRTDKTRKIKGL